MTISSVTGNQFLSSSSDIRRQILDRLGLLRYAEFLLPLTLSDRNAICVERFLNAPDRVKFPQLQGADLSGLMLSEANLIRADLSGTNLRNAQLQNANLLFARAIAADFRGADLRGATFSCSNWTHALVEGCNFGCGNGLTAAQTRTLRERGALFD